MMVLMDNGTQVDGVIVNKDTENSVEQGMFEMFIRMMATVEVTGYAELTVIHGKTMRKFQVSLEDRKNV